MFGSVHPPDLVGRGPLQAKGRRKADDRRPTTASPYNDPSIPRADGTLTVGEARKSGEVVIQGQPGSGVRFNLLAE